MSKIYMLFINTTEYYQKLMKLDSLEFTGAFYNLYFYIHTQKLPFEKKLIIKIAGLANRITEKKYQKFIDMMLDPDYDLGFYEKDGLLRNTSLDAESQRIEKIRIDKSNAGKKSAEIRKLKAQNVSDLNNDQKQGVEKEKQSKNSTISLDQSNLNKDIKNSSMVDLYNKLAKKNKVEEPPISLKEQEKNNQFEEFWKLYQPINTLKASKSEAKKKFESALVNYEYQLVIDKTKEYINYCHSTNTYTKACFRWLQDSIKNKFTSEYPEVKQASTLVIPKKPSKYDLYCQ